MVPEPETGGRPAKHERWEVVNAIFYVVRSGCAWLISRPAHHKMTFVRDLLKFCLCEYVFAGPGCEPYTNQSFNAHLGRVCKDLRLQTVLTARGLRHSAATILLNDQGKNLREVQEALRHRDIRTTARYTHVAPEHTRATMDALAGSLPAWRGTFPTRGARRGSK